MYYDLTKEQYKKYEKKFKKTYVGKEYFQAYLTSAIGTLIFAFVAGFVYGYTEVVTLNDMAYLFGFTVIAIGCGLECVLWHTQYRKELKNYILSKNND